ncbi:alpha/beta hydrolase [Priestia aryabhattai]|uniref:Alpha/beta hydrolase n=1 Tax=Priestia aryabhattai TaxID=412384 RepID=A0AAX6NDM0_PRIAR|nr:alpha/beta hydrolase [Priestia aryabhattai]MDU9694001.1 alpha/beta hydrolase [Priestia aryabhattai]
MKDTVRIGKMQDIGGINLYYEFVEQPKSTVTVVFESGYGCSSEYWGPIKETVGEFAQYVMYDRQGLGKSENDDRSKDSNQAVKNLRALLQGANIKPPYVLVGHSIGGINVRLYASKYPEEVAAIVMLDSCHPDQNIILPPLFDAELKKNYFKQFVVEGNSDDIDTSFNEARYHSSLGDIPLKVVSAGLQTYHTKASHTAWNLLQRDLLHLSKNSKQIVVENAGHVIHIDQPNVVTSIIRYTLEEINF